MPPRAISVVPAAALREGLEAIRREAGVPERFPDDVLAEAEAARAEPRERVDIEFVTIDPPGARDLDQAMHIERRGDGHRVHYAIADPGAFITPGGALDRETHARAVTVYMPDGKIPLHPPVLSEGAASLLPATVAAGGAVDARPRRPRRADRHRGPSGGGAQRRAAHLRGRAIAAAARGRRAAAGARARARRRAARGARAGGRPAGRRLDRALPRIAAERGAQRPDLAAERDGGGSADARRRDRHPAHAAAARRARAGAAAPDRRSARRAVAGGSLVSRVRPHAGPDEGQPRRGHARGEPGGARRGLHRVRRRAARGRVPLGRRRALRARDGAAAPTAGPLRLRVLPGRAARAAWRRSRPRWPPAPGARTRSSAPSSTSSRPCCWRAARASASTRS